MNGRAAEFLSGGEVPVQVAAGLGTNSIEFRPFGTKLDVVPIILGQGRVRLEIRAEVSEIAPDLSGNTNTPGFRVRRVNTGVEMNVGHTLALAGDYREQFESERSQVPFVGDRPIIGQLFRNKKDSTNEVELVFMITPRFVGEVDASLVPARGPGQMSSRPSDKEFYLHGYDEVPYCGDDCPTNGYSVPSQVYGYDQNAAPHAGSQRATEFATAAASTAACGGSEAIEPEAASDPASFATHGRGPYHQLTVQLSPALMSEADRGSHHPVKPFYSRKAAFCGFPFFTETPVAAPTSVDGIDISFGFPPSRLGVITLPVPQVPITSPQFCASQRISLCPRLTVT